MLSTIYIFTFCALAGNLSLHTLATLPKVHWSLCIVCVILLFARHLRWRLLGSFCLGFFWTAIAVSPHSELKATNFGKGETVEVVGTVATIPIPRTGSLQFIMDIIEAPDIDHFPKRIRTTVYDATARIQVSDRLRAVIKIKAPYGFANPHTFDYERWLWMQGIEATAYIISYRLVEGSAVVGDFKRWRQELYDKLQFYSHLFAHVDSIAAITLGLSSLLSYRQREILAATGTHHLFAVSGLHIGLVFGFFFVLIERLWRLFFLNRCLYPSHKIAMLGALPAAVAYAALAGFSLPTQRALIMLLCIICAHIFKYKISLLQSLSVALLLILIYDPSATLSISFWLSFIAVAMIAFFLLIVVHMQGWKMWFGMQAYIATVMLVPSLLFFTYGGLLSPLANMLIIPITAFAVLPCSLIAVVCFMINDTVALFFMHLADDLFAILWQINAWLAGYPMIWFRAINNVTAFFSLFGILLFIAFKASKMRFLILLLLFPLFPPFATPSPIAAGDFKAVFFDVGQGLSVLIQTRNHSLIYDTGPRYRSGFNTAGSVVLPYLRSQNITAIDTLIVSHTDNDHAGGAEILMRYLAPRRLLGGEAFTVSGKSFTACRQGQSWIWDNVYFEILHPPSPSPYEGNNASCVLRIANSRHSLLLTADIEKQAERILSAHPALNSDVLLIPHHGSRTSSTEPFIDSVSPAIAVVTSGYRNRFALPKPDVVNRYYTRGIQVLDTAKTGALTFDFPAYQNFDVRSYRLSRLHYWRNLPNAPWPPGE